MDGTTCHFGCNNAGGIEREDTVAAVMFLEQVDYSKTCPIVYPVDSTISISRFFIYHPFSSDERNICSLP
jgi:hypothetical protein